MHDPSRRFKLDTEITAELFTPQEPGGYSQTVNHAQAASSYGSLPGEHVTVNQVVAYNMRYFRKAAGMTQEELGERIGLSFRAVSAAEKTWERTDGRGRIFDADLMARIAWALGVPVTALLLPPADDGIEKRYTFRAEQDMTTEMRDLAWLAISDPSEPSAEDTGAMNAYQQRYAQAFRDYLGEDLAARTGAGIPATQDAVKDELKRLSHQHAVLRQVLADNDRLQGALSDRLLSSPGKRPDKEPD